MANPRFRDGYLREDDYGVSLIDSADDVTYSFGMISQNAVHPSPSTVIQYGVTAVGEQEVSLDQVWKEMFDLSGMYPVGMKNGILLQAVMGGSSTVDEGGGVYTHTIAPAAPVDGVIPPLPSFTIHHERLDYSPVWVTQFLGAKVSSLLLTCGMEQRYLIARADWLAQKPDSPIAFQLDDAPILPPTKNIEPYHFRDFSMTFDGTPFTGLNYMELSISPDFTKEQPPAWSDEDDYLGQWLTSLVESPRKKYSLSMDLLIQDSTFFLELLDLENTKDIVFTWTRGANDYIEATLSNCQFRAQEMYTPQIRTSHFERVICEPPSLSFEVQDGIAGGHYGE